MNKTQAAARANNIAVLARNYPNVDAAKLQDKLYALALKCERNATELCNTPNYTDRRAELRAELHRIERLMDVVLRAEVTGDPRGFCLRLHLPNGDYNTLGGAESGYGIGSN
jgi:hypothetical protein